MLFCICRLELAKCLSNPSCAANIACLQTCNNRPDETECQVSLVLYMKLMPASFFFVSQTCSWKLLFLHNFLRLNAGTCLKTVWLMNSMSVQSHGRNVCLRNLIWENFLLQILISLLIASTLRISVANGSSLVA